MNGSESKRDWHYSYASIIGMMLYPELNTRTDIPFAAHQCAGFTHNTKASHETAVKRICRYLQGTKDNGLVFNQSKKLLVYCYADADFSGLWGHKNLHEPICARSRTVFLVTFANFPLLWVSKLQTEIALSTLHYEYMALYHPNKELLPLKSLIKEVIDNLVIDSDNLKFVSSSTIYEEID